MVQEAAAHVKVLGLVLLPECHQKFATDDPTEVDKVLMVLMPTKVEVGRGVHGQLCVVWQFWTNAEGIAICKTLHALKVHEPTPDEPDFFGS